MAGPQEMNLASLPRETDLPTQNSGEPILIVPPQAVERPSPIEGIRATIGEVPEFEARRQASSWIRRDHILEVISIAARPSSARNGMLKERPLSQGVIRESHRVLLSRGPGGAGPRRQSAHPEVHRTRRMLHRKRRIRSRRRGRMGAVRPPGPSRPLGTTGRSARRV